VESTCNFVVVGRRDYGDELLNPAGNVQAVKKYGGLKHACDPPYAQWLTNLLRLGLILTGYIFQKSEHVVCDLLGKLSQLIRHKTIVALSLKISLT